MPKNESGRREHRCKTPGCHRPVYNKTRQLCSRCVHSFYYWRAKPGGLKKSAAARQRQLKFWNDRLAWFVDSQ